MNQSQTKQPRDERNGRLNHYLAGSMWALASSGLSELSCVLLPVSVGFVRAEVFQTSANESVKLVQPVSEKGNNNGYVQKIVNEENAFIFE